MEENKIVKQTLIIKNREEVTIDGILNVEGFDEGYVWNPFATFCKHHPFFVPMSFGKKFFNCSYDIYTSF